MLFTRPAPRGSHASFLPIRASRLSRVKREPEKETVLQCKFCKIQYELTLFLSKYSLKGTVGEASTILDKKSPIFVIQSKNSANTREHSEGCHAIMTQRCLATLGQISRAWSVLGDRNSPSTGIQIFTLPSRRERQA